MPRRRPKEHDAARQGPSRVACPPLLSLDGPSNGRGRRSRELISTAARVPRCSSAAHGSTRKFGYRVHCNRRGPVRGDIYGQAVSTAKGRRSEGPGRDGVSRHRRSPKRPAPSWCRDFFRAGRRPGTLRREQRGDGSKEVLDTTDPPGAAPEAHDVEVPSRRSGALRRDRGRPRGRRLYKTHLDTHRAVHSSTGRGRGGGRPVRT